MPDGFGSGKAARMSWGHPCAGGIWLGGGGKDGGDGGVCAEVMGDAGGRAPVRFGRWDLAQRR